MATSFGIHSVLSQPDHFEDFESRADSADLLHRKAKAETWYLGKGLGPSSMFTYKVCDMILIIPESPNHCYQIRLEFIDTLKSPHGDVWIVQAVIDHQGKRAYSIFQIFASTFDITTDGTSIPYADSVSRTIFWIGKFANELGQKPLTVGKPWGKIATYTAPQTELVVRDTKVISLDNKEQFQTFVLGYNLIEQSSININGDFPFPIKAVIYKPTTSHQNIPLQFTIELVDHTRNDYLDAPTLQTFLNQNESPNNFEDDVLLNETSMDGDADDNNTTENNELNVTTNTQVSNSNSTGTNYLDLIDLEKLFEMFLEHLDNETSDEQILNYTVFLDFFNKTDSAVIVEQNSTKP